jgi:intracellular septation protein A
MDVKFKVIPLILIITCNHKSIIKLLINKKASLVIKDERFNKITLSWVTRNNFLKIINILLKALKGNDN